MNSLRFTKVVPCRRTHLWWTSLILSSINCCYQCWNAEIIKTVKNDLLLVCLFGRTTMHDDVTVDNFRETQGVYVLVLKLFLMSSHVQFAYCFRCPKIFQRFVLGDVDNFSKNWKIRRMIVSVKVRAFFFLDLASLNSLLFPLFYA